MREGGIYPRVPLVYVYIIIRHDTVLDLLLVTLFVIGGLVRQGRGGLLGCVLAGRLLALVLGNLGNGAAWRVYLGLVCEFPGLGLFNGWLMYEWGVVLVYSTPLRTRCNRERAYCFSL